jgi:hypothetical protein
MGILGELEGYVHSTTNYNGKNPRSWYYINIGMKWLQSSPKLNIIDGCRSFLV